MEGVGEAFVSDMVLCGRRNEIGMLGVASSESRLRMAKGREMSKSRSNVETVHSTVGSGEIRGVLFKPQTSALRPQRPDRILRRALGPPWRVSDSGEVFGNVAGGEGSVL